jgi:arylsulfatase A-like enzyme
MLGLLTGSVRPRVAAVAAALLLALPLLARVADAAPRNILLLIGDDLGIDAAEFYPTTVRRVTDPPAPPMPNMRRLAQAGVLFRDAWANPLCAPTRATLFTGRYSFRTGVGANTHEDPELPTLRRTEFLLPEAFQARPALGYVLAHVGKWHVSHGDTDPNLHGWPYFAGGDPWRPGNPSYFSWTKHINDATAASTTYVTTDQVNEALGVIRRARTQGRPYFLQLALYAPHSPFHKPPNHLHSRDALPRYVKGMDPRPYFEAMAEALDTEIGRLLDGVDLATTTVIFVGDNGTTGSVIESPYPSSKDKGTMYQGGVRVPLLVAGAGVVDPGRLVPALANTVDLYPTILELAGIDPAAVVPAGTKLDGVSLLPYIRKVAHPSPRRWAYAERFRPVYNQGYQRAIRNARYKLIERASGSRAFYDLAADPLETTNLLGRTLTEAQRASLASLDRQLDALLATR